MPSRAVHLLALASVCLGLSFGLAACGGNDDSGSVTLTKLPANPQNGSTPGKPDDGKLDTGGATAGEEQGGEEQGGETTAGSGEEAPAETGGGTSTANTAGKEIFTQSCAGCHTLADAGATGSVGPNLDEAKPDEAKVAAMVRSGGGGMPSFGGTLQPEQIDEVAAYVAASAGS